MNIGELLPIELVVIFGDFRLLKGCNHSWHGLVAFVVID
jgi:hypothetical protein